MEPTESNNAKTTVENEGKTIAIIAYITIIGLIVAFVMNNDKKWPFAKYHIAQSLGLALTGILLGIIGMVPILGWIINIIGFFVLIYMWVMGLINAVNENENPVPILGKHYEKWFANI
ncbi:MAG TPA: hypothetical protein PKL92_05750 [Aquaticitalea sp.]|nr:hypothetical protein [Aquaticitalea sp.]